MKSKWVFSILVAAVLLAALALFSACGAEEVAEDEQPTVIEEGLPQATETDVEEGEDEPAEPAPQFIDKGEASTLEDLSANLDLVESYYFEQSVSYPEGQVFMQVWYKDQKMKLITSVDGYGLTESYYDYAASTVVDYYIGSSETAVGSSFDPNGDNAPTNPKMEDYATDTLAGTETVDRQCCAIVETAAGDRLWVSTLYGFPLRVEYTDSLGDRYVTDYKNLSINTVEDADVEVPADLEVSWN